MNTNSFKLGKATAAFLFYWFPVGLWLAFIFYLSSQPSSNFPHIATVTYLDKAVHIIEYGVLAILLLRAIFYHGQYRQKKLLVFLVVFLFCTGYGLTDEIHQSFVEERFVELADIAADGLGALVAIIFSGFIFGKWGVHNDKK